MSVDVKLFDDLDDVERDAVGGLDRDEQPRLFDRLSWYRMVSSQCPPPGRLVAARAKDGSRPGAWLFLAVEGGRARAFANWYSLRTGPIGELAGVISIARALKSASIFEITLSPLDSAEDAAGAFREGGWLTFVTEATTNWQIDTRDQDFAAYWAKRPSRLRNTAQRKAKTADLDIAIHRRFNEAAWADYESIYEASWKPEEGSPAFLHALAEQEGAAGTLRLGIASKDGKPLAAQLWLVENGEATIHKLAYREDAKELSPGTVLSMAMFRSALDEDKVRRIDYGTGDDGYKRDWMEERMPLFRLTAYNPGTVKGLAGAARAWASSLVRRVRSR